MPLIDYRRYFTNKSCCIVRSHWDGHRNMTMQTTRHPWFDIPGGLPRVNAQAALKTNVGLLESILPWIRTSVVVDYAPGACICCIDKNVIMNLQEYTTVVENVRQFCSFADRACIQDKCLRWRSIWVCWSAKLANGLLNCCRTFPFCVRSLWCRRLD